MNDRVKLGVSVGGIAALVTSGVLVYQTLQDDAPEPSPQEPVVVNVNIEREGETSSHSNTMKSTETESADGEFPLDRSELDTPIDVNIAYESGYARGYADGRDGEPNAIAAARTETSLPPPRQGNCTTAVHPTFTATATLAASSPTRPQVPRHRLLLQRRR